MKRILIVVALAALLVFAMTGTAFAKNAVVNWPGADTSALPDSNLIYNPWTTTSSATWAADDYPANAGSTSPHGGYTATTVKCAVCHAVHVASPDGDTLLKMEADQACISCHVAAQLGGTNMVYGGSAAIANASGMDHHTTSSNCSRCHASVHGAGAIQDVPSITSIILAEQYSNDQMNPRLVNSWITTGTAIEGLTTAQVDTLLNTSAAATTREVAIGLFCQGCHSGSYQNGVAGTLGNGNDGSAIGDRTGHRVGTSVVANTSYDPPYAYNLAATSTASFTGQVAWVAATNCKSCHDAAQFADGTGGFGFPHFTQGAARFLNRSTSAAETSTPTGLSVSADASYTGTETAVYPGTGDAAVAEFSLRDGVCLKCHKGTTTTGVGSSY